MPEDEDELVQRLGLTAREVRVRNLSVVLSFCEYLLVGEVSTFFKSLRRIRLKVRITAKIIYY